MKEFIANRPLFPRNSHLVINGMKINDENNDGLKFEVDAKTGEEGKVGVADIKIYNLTQNIEVGSDIEVWFGYADDIGYYSSYEVISKKKSKDNGSYIQTLICSERTKNSSKIVSISLDGNIRCTQAIQEIVKSMGLNLMKLQVEKDKIYTNGYTCYNQGFSELKALVQDSESKMTIKGDDIYIYTDKEKTYRVLLSFESGLIHNPQACEKQENENKVNSKTDNEKTSSWDEKNKKNTVKNSNKYDYVVETLPIHYIKKGDIVYIKSDLLTDYVQVENIELKLSGTWQMKLGVKVINNGGNKNNTSKNTSN